MFKSFFLLALAFPFIGTLPEARAYLNYNPNEKLAEEVSRQSWRVIPKSEHYTFAIDGDFFKPAFFGDTNSSYYQYDFYHGNGYWIDLRGEFKPIPDLVLNLKFDLTHGTSSNGPTYGVEIIPHAAITYRTEGLLGLKLETRLSDIGRQTVGEGLFIEEKETEGGYLLAESGSFAGKFMVDGTGSYNLQGGVLTLDLSIWQHLLGFTGFVQETANEFNPPALMGTIYSRQKWESGLVYGVEAGGDRYGTACLSYLQWSGETSHFQYLIKPQFRHYGSGLLGGLPRNVQHGYLAYEQNDKPFTTLMNIYSYGDQVNTYSVLMNFTYEFSSFYRVYLEPEALRFQYQNRELIQSLYFRTGLKFFPFKNRNDEFGFLVGNKYLIASTSRGNSSVFRTYSDPLSFDKENKPLFLQQLYGMINFETHF